MSDEFKFNGVSFDYRKSPDCIIELESEVWAKFMQAAIAGKCGHAEDHDDAADEICRRNFEYRTDLRVSRCAVVADLSLEEFRRRFVCDDQHK